MNCVKGDLAVVVRAPSDAAVPVGSLVEVLDFLGAGKACGTGMKFRLASNLWDVSFRGSTTHPTGYRYGIPDANLRPIRDQPGADETLIWATLPSPTPIKETA